MDQAEEVMEMVARVTVLWGYEKATLSIHYHQNAGYILKLASETAITYPFRFEDGGYFGHMAILGLVAKARNVSEEMLSHAGSFLLNRPEVSRSRARSALVKLGLSETHLDQALGAKVPTQVLNTGLVRWKAGKVGTWEFDLLERAGKIKLDDAYHQYLVEAIQARRQFQTEVVEGLVKYHLSIWESDTNPEEITNYVRAGMLAWDMGLIRKDDPVVIHYMEVVAQMLLNTSIHGEMWELTRAAITAHHMVLTLGGNPMLIPNILNVYNSRHPDD